MQGTPSNKQNSGLARWNLIFAYTSLFCYGLADNIRGPIYPEIRNHFLLTDTQGSWFFALASATGVGGGLTISYLLKRFSYRRTFQISMLIMIASQIIFAVSNLFSLFLLGSFLFGIATGFLGVVQNVLVVVAAKGPQLSRWMSGLHANYGLASLIAPLIVTGMSFVSGDFRAGFWCISALSILLLLTSFRVPEFLEPAAPPLQRTETKGSGGIAFMALVLALYVGAEVLLGTRIAQYSRDEMGADLRESALWTSLFFVGLFAGRVLSVLYHPPWSFRRRLMIGLLLSTAACLGGLLVTPWLFGLMGLVMGPCYPLAMALISEIYHLRVSRAMQLCLITANTMLVIMHFSVGRICDLVSIRGALLLAPAALILAAILILFLPRPAPGEVAHA